MNWIQGRWVVVVAVVVVILVDVWQHAHVVTLGYEVEHLQELRHQQLKLNRDLAIERSSLMALGRIESIAKTQLGLARPTEGQVVLVEAPAPTPAVPGNKLTIRVVHR